MMNTNRNTFDNGVDERDSQADQLSPGSGFAVYQASQGRHQATGTARRRYSREDNKAVMECYYKSKLDETGYRQRMHNTWNENGGFDISETRLADQVRMIRRNKWFTPVELDELKIRVNKQNDEDQVEEDGDAVEPTSEENVETEDDSMLPDAEPIEMQETYY